MLFYFWPLLSISIRTQHSILKSLVLSSYSCYPFLSWDLHAFHAFFSYHFQFFKYDLLQTKLVLGDDYSLIFSIVLNHSYQSHHHTLHLSCLTHLARTCCLIQKIHFKTILCPPPLLLCFTSWFLLQFLHLHQVQICN